MAKRQRPPPRVQSLLVPKTLGLQGAMRWAIDHGFRVPAGRAAAIDEGQDFYRIRQFAPGKCQRGKIRTIPLGQGVKATICPLRAGEVKTNPGVRTQRRPSVKGHTRNALNSAVSLHTDQERYDMASALLKDTANARMRKAGRTAWSRADYNAGIDVYNRVMRIPLTPRAPTRLWRERMLTGRVQNPPAKNSELPVHVMGKIPGQSIEHIYRRPRTRAGGRTHPAGVYTHKFSKGSRQLVVRIPDGRLTVLHWPPPGKALVKEDP